ncbi:hypothetical protein Ahy_A05g024024 [Arachis hypogaea]|uniref:Uncharacterized protein n=1 Tax=Arachis hypogaea TaxID=3818 RepID=A0A445D525_ARAHY|nr:hypothetical protein Ahy_A05g024024 [Arachis hypogaea]
MMEHRFSPEAVTKFAGSCFLDGTGKNFSGVIMLVSRVFRRAVLSEMILMNLLVRRDRCGCKPTKEDVKRYFMLEFDRSVSLNGSGAVASSVPNSSAFFGSSLKKVTSRIHSSSKVSSGRLQDCGDR